MPRRLSALAFVLACLVSVVHAADVVRFRGNDGSGHGDGTNLPAEWSSTKNVVWKAEMPGAGGSSPIVLGNRVFLTSYSGYAQSTEEPGDQEDLMRHVVCIDRKSGDKLWQKDFEPKLPESAYSGGNNSRHGYSTSTPTTDGERLYVFFGKSGVYALDLSSGETIWHVSVGEGTRGWGSSNSPVLFGDLLIVNASIESQRVVALDKRTGKEIWNYGGVKGGWVTPLIVEVPGGKPEAVLSLPERIVGLDPLTGDELWNCTGIPDRGYTCPSPVAHEGIVYVVGGRKNTAIAVKAGGRGEVEPLWTTGKGSNVSSCVYHDGFIYWVHEGRGIFYCLNAETGEVVVESRLDPKPGLIYSSMLVADGKLYAVSQKSGTYVFAAKPEYELLANNVFEDDPARVNGCPIVHDDQLLLRTDSALYCIGTK